jgi:hypothetical protein
MMHVLRVKTFTDGEYERVWAPFQRLAATRA